MYIVAYSPPWWGGEKNQRFLSGEENQRWEGKRGRKSKEVRGRKKNGGGKKMVPGKGKKRKIRKKKIALLFFIKNWRSHLNLPLKI